MSEWRRNNKKKMKKRYQKHAQNVSKCPKLQPKKNDFPPHTTIFPKKKTKKSSFKQQKKVAQTCNSFFFGSAATALQKKIHTKIQNVGTLRNFI